MIKPKYGGAIDVIVHEPGYGPVEQTFKFWSVAMAEQYIQQEKPENVTIVNGPYECERDPQ